MKIYFVRICGKLNGPLAVSLKKKGYDVAGSDKGFYPPISTYLKDNGVDLLVGFKEEHITSDIDLAIISTGPNNPEFKKIKELGIRYESVGKLIQHEYIKKNSIVVAGTYGKTTTTAFITFLLKEAGINPTHMIGGEPLNFTDPTELTDSDWSVFEGDEYITSYLDPIPKFMYYHPTELVLNAVKHDHLDIYKSEEDYLGAFKKLLNSMPSGTNIYANINGENVKSLLSPVSDKNILYINTDINSSDKNNNIFLSLSSYSFVDGKTTFSVIKDNETIDFETEVIGEHNIKNLVMGIAVGLNIGINIEMIKKSVKAYKGVKKRMEIKGNDKYVVIEDYAHSPIEAKSTISSTKKLFGNKRIIAIYDPHTLGFKLKESLNEYKGLGDEAEEILIIPILHSSLTLIEDRITSVDIASSIGNNAKGFVSKEELIEYLDKIIKEGDVILFMSSGNIEKLIQHYL